MEEKEKQEYLQMINKFRNAGRGDSQIFESMIQMLNDGFDLKESDKEYLKELDSWFKDKDEKETENTIKLKCYICKNEFGRFSTKHQVEEILNKEGKIPEGMTDKDRICLNDFMLLTNQKDEDYYRLRIRVDEYKKNWDRNGVIQFKNKRIAILHRVWGQQVEFIIAYDDLTNEGYRCIAHDEGVETEFAGMTAGINSYFYFQKMEYVR